MTSHKTRKELYLFNKSAKTKTEITCPVCKTTFIKKQYSQAFCCSQCKDAYWNSKGDRHKDPEYYNKYNAAHPERLERLGIYDDYEDDSWMFCENPILGI